MFGPKIEGSERSRNEHWDCFSMFSDWDRNKHIVTCDIRKLQGKKRPIFRLLQEINVKLDPEEAICEMN
jgi:hypothetical protein